MNKRVVSDEWLVASGEGRVASADQVRLEDAIRTARVEAAARAFIVRYSLGCLRAAKQAEAAGFAVDWARLADDLTPCLRPDSTPYLGVVRDGLGLGHAQR